MDVLDGDLEVVDDLRDERVREALVLELVLLVELAELRLLLRKQLQLVQLLPLHPQLPALLAALVELGLLHRGHEQVAVLDQDLHRLRLQVRPRDLHRQRPQVPAPKVQRKIQLVQRLPLQLEVRQSHVPRPDPDVELVRVEVLHIGPQRPVEDISYQRF